MQELISGEYDKKKWTFIPIKLPLPLDLGVPENNEGIRVMQNYLIKGSL